MQQTLAAKWRPPAREEAMNERNEDRTPTAPHPRRRPRRTLARLVIMIGLMVSIAGVSAGRAEAAPVPRTLWVCGHRVDYLVDQGGIKLTSVDSDSLWFEGYLSYGPFWRGGAYVPVASGDWFYGWGARIYLPGYPNCTSSFV
jgi:hypothetical protein